MTAASATKLPVTNGEYYDYTLKTWVVQCGQTAVPINKRDASGQPVPPPEEEKPAELLVSKS